jgi:hypothetical protein
MVVLTFISREKPCGVSARARRSASAHVAATPTRIADRRRKVRRVRAVSWCDRECDCVSDWLCILLSVCLRLCGRAWSLSCYTVTGASVAAAQNSDLIDEYNKFRQYITGAGEPLLPFCFPSILVFRVDEREARS